MDQDDGGRIIARALIAQVHIHPQDRDECGGGGGPAGGKRRKRLVGSPIRGDAATEQGDDGDQCAGDDFRADFHAENSLDTATSNNNGAALVAFLAAMTTNSAISHPIARLVTTGYFATNPN